ncbi:MAG TPA: ImmA/IrrE family metallo-endopeptidase [Terracidiphilus sp.]|jgi:hypothetical protein
MTQTGVSEFDRAVDIARFDARALQRSFPFFFTETRVPVLDLAIALGLRIRERADLGQRAQLELVKGAEGTEANIVLRSGLDQNVRRFAVAHEVGHYLLLKNREQFASVWGIESRERFANTFAGEVLISPAGWAQINSTFPSISDPLELLRLASAVGISPHALLTQVTARRPLIAGLTKIWLRVKHAVNAVTGSEPRLRIISAHYDRERFFIPENQSVNSFAGADMWLFSLPIGVSFHQQSAVAVKLRRPPDSTPRFLSRSVQAEISAVRLPPNTYDNNSVFIVLADVGGSLWQATEQA